MITQLKHIIFLTALYLLCLSSLCAQKLFHQDVFYGGVTSAGWSGGTGGMGSGTIEVHIEPGSTIRNAWLFMYRLGKPEPTFFQLNGEIIYHEELSLLNEVYHYDMGSVELYYKDVKDLVNPNNLIFSVELFLHSFGPENNWGWCMPVLYIEYDNSSLEKVTTSLWSNDQDFRGLEEYTFFNMNPIDNTNYVGLSLMIDRACSNLMDRTFVWLNGAQLTTNTSGVGGYNNNSFHSCAGVRGHFYYQNQELFGLDSAVPDSVMDDNDALANIASYLNNNATGYELRLQHWQWPPPMGAGWPNILTLIPHAYITPCDTFSTSVWFQDTTICKGDTIQLGAVGGINYVWEGANLDDNDSATPFVAPDSSCLYVVRIENEPGCYRTEQVMVKVNEPPNITSLEITPSICGKATGELRVFASGNGPYISSIGQGDQNQALFTNLLSGDYPLSVTDVNGCTADTTITIPYEIDVVASFTASPQQGSEPLDVDLINTSENATQYEWFIDTSFWDDSYHSGVYFDSAGVYTITLIASNDDPACQDTFQVDVIVKDTMILQIPNVFTPNNDGVNDLFTIAIRGAAHIEGSILNRWGNTMTTIQQNLTPHQQTLPLWDGFSNGQPATEGVYFYTIIVTDRYGKEHVFNGFFHLNR